MDIASEEGIRSVVLRRSESSGMGLGLGFSIMGGAGYEFPPVIYGIEKDSPAAISGMLEAGDVILSINEREVVKLSTKEVLKCLRLSGDIVHIKFKRDPHVVSRVRQFLSTPNYLEGQDNHIHHHQSSSPSKQNRSKKSSQIPIYQHQLSTQSPQPQPLQGILLSPNRSSSIPPYAHAFGEGDHVSITNKQNFQNNIPGHISFTDELFINHSFQHQSLLCQHSPTNKPSNKTNAHFDKHQNLQNENAKLAGNKNGRKNFETFVMTGDAILNVSKEANDSFKTSPLKTTSKLMPMPHMPIFVERDKDYNRRLLLEKEMERQEREKDKDKSESEKSPPLPPPPPLHDIKEPSNDTNSYSSDRNKSDHLPPPPPDISDLVGAEKSSSLKNGHSHNENGALCNNIHINNRTDGATGVNNHSNNNDHNPNRCSNHQNQLPSNNNNEDTSISSSVMSDSGDELGDDEDVKKMIAPCGSNSNGTRSQFKVGARKSNSIESYDAERERDSEFAEVVAEKVHERERYNEYILLNGSRGTLNEDDLSGSGGRQSAQQYSYSQAINKDEKTPSTVTGGRDNSENGDSDAEVDSENSENDIIGAGCDRISGHIGGNESFSGGESDSSDVESMRVAPVTKAVDLPSAERLAKRLFQLDGFKSTDVWRHLSKNTDFNRVVAMEYLNFFTFKDETLDISLRKFLAVCPLRGETQDRERVLSYFSARYVDCNPETFGTQDSVHTLTCALMLLNTDIYSGIRNQRMTCSEFIENLSGLNEGGDFPRDVLKQLYLSIRSQPLVSPSDADDEDSTKDILPMDPPSATSNVEFKRGYLVRKCTNEYGGKKTPLGKRSWKMFFCRLKELLLALSPDETMKTPAPNAILIKLHHSFATLASDYRKRRNVLRLILADRSQFLFQSSDTREMHSWIDMLNWNAARFSSPALDAPCSSTGKFEKPLLPSCVTRMSRREQAATHQTALTHWEKELDTLTHPKKKGSLKKEDKEKLIFYQYEIRRYRTYLEILEKRANAENSERNGGEELVELQVLPNPPILMEEEN